MRDAPSPSYHAPPPAASAGPGRRAFVTGAMAAAGLAAVGCAPPDTLISGRTRLRQWNLFAGGDGLRMIEMHEAYKAEHPDIDFRATTFTWGAPFYTKVAMGAAGGRGADIATAHVSRLESLAPGRLLDPIDPAMLAEAGIDDTVVLPNIWEKCFFDGRLYAIPLDTHVLIQYYHLDVCRQAGLLDADDRLVEVSGTEEYFDMLREIKAVTGTYGLSIDTWNPWSNFWALYRQQDGELVLGEDDYEMDDDKALAAMEVLYRLSEEGLAPRHSMAADTAANLANGQAGLMIHGNWEIPTLEATGVGFSATQFPAVFGNHRTRGDSHCYVFPHQRDRDPERTRAAVEYAAWMLRHSLTWAKGGHIPAYQPVVESPEYDELHPQSEYREAAENVQFEPQAWFSGSAGRLQEEATGALTTLHQGTQTPEQALAQLKATIRELLTVPSPV
ncbi:multiple sugar transport system substrate-binding protein [Nocardiopsis arvandica]|uniref:Multiple sugar transport system substrate-binding protein n=1 Tax=Nocardiopsis sinuspersici TaxID=501010 RepID=A0A7Y9XEB3_9ACTN|nr:extracellular solute-binding protein [Nocardiopsis sinuspersici]NYH54216.1 multiple sugar transport system substrate-binding protein [Nocardiopsis sinuspersici]